MTISLDSLNVYLLLAVNGIFTGCGCALGTYIAQKHLIVIPKKIKKRIKKLYRR